MWICAWPNTSLSRCYTAKNTCFQCAFLQTSSPGCICASFSFCLKASSSSELAVFIVCWTKTLFTTFKTANPRTHLSTQCRFHVQTTQRLFGRILARTTFAQCSELFRCYLGNASALFGRGTRKGLKGNGALQESILACNRLPVDRWRAGALWSLPDRWRAGALWSHKRLFWVLSGNNGHLETNHLVITELQLHKPRS